jgi:heme A synthase
MALGIVTLLLAVPLWAGLAHQVLAMAVLAMAVAHARLSRLQQASKEKGGLQEAAPIFSPVAGDQRTI